MASGALSFAVRSARGPYLPGLPARQPCRRPGWDATGPERVCSFLAPGRARVTSTSGSLQERIARMPTATAHDRMHLVALDAEAHLAEFAQDVEAGLATGP